MEQDDLEIIMKRTVVAEVKSKGPNEPLERLIRRFNKKVKKEKILEQVRANRHYEKPSEKRRRRAKQRKRVLDKLRKKHFH